jgi:anaerobic selenocysteine-containing dehydrogenase
MAELKRRDFLKASAAIAVASAAVVLALELMPASAAATHYKRHSKGAAAAQPQIACTVVGCMPVPRGCHPEMGYTPDGTPTGFDVVVCPNYTLYGRNISNY